MLSVYTYRRRLSSFGNNSIMSTIREEEQEINTIEEPTTFDWRHLEAALTNAVFRQELVATLLAAHSVGAREIRFVVAVRELENLKSRDKQVKAKKISHIFLDQDSTFRLKELPSSAKQQLQWRMWNLQKSLVLIKIALLKNLLEDPLVTSQLQEFL